MHLPRRLNDKLDPSELPLFAGVQPERVALITEHMVRHFGHGQALFHQGEDANTLYVLLHGSVRILASGTFLVARQPYELVGEQAFIERGKRSAIAEAQGHVEALALPRQVVEVLMEDARFNRNLLEIISGKLSQSTNERAYRFLKEERLFAEFQAHVSPVVADRLLAAGEDYGKPQYIDAVILFSDIRSFTDRSAGMSPHEVAEQLSPYLDAVVDLIHKHDGMVDKFIGDAVMAIWGYAPAEGDLAVRALECARSMVDLASCQTFGGQPISIGVGLNAGRVFIGNIGGNGKRQFTVLGTPVNLAARFESASKDLAAPIVVGQDFYNRLPSEWKERLVAREGCEIKGAETQTLYTYHPALGAGQGDQV